MNNILGTIGLAKRAGLMSVGSVACDEAIKLKVAKLTIVASDASKNTKKSINNSCIYYKVPCVEFSDMENLGKYSGGGEKAVVTINDEKFASAIMQKIEMVYGKDR